MLPSCNCTSFYIVKVQATYCVPYHICCWKRRNTINVARRYNMCMTSQIVWYNFK